MSDIPNTWQEAADQLHYLKTLQSLSSSHCENYLAKFITADEDMDRLKKAVRVISCSPNITTIFITGPSGHGKELIARACHYATNAPFIPVNCGALPFSLLTSLLFGHMRGTFTGATEDRAGVFEAAGVGTVFLDEIGEMPPEQQPALLRILQEREVTRLGDTVSRPITCRIVAATNDHSRIRTDLLGRLMGVWLRIKPLTQRPADVQLIAQSIGLDITDVSAHAAQLDIFGVRHLQALQQAKQLGL